MSQGSPEDVGNVVEPVALPVKQGIPVGIRFVTSYPWNIHQTELLEQAVVGNIAQFSILEVLRRTLSGKYHVAGIPAEFVVPGVVVAFRRHHAACVRTESGDFTAFGFENQAAFAGFICQAVHFAGNVGSGDQMFFQLDAIVGHLQMEVSREQGNHYIGTADQLPPVVGFEHI